MSPRRFIRLVYGCEMTFTKFRFVWLLPCHTPWVSMTGPGYLRACMQAIPPGTHDHIACTLLCVLLKLSVLARVQFCHIRCLADPDPKFVVGLYDPSTQLLEGLSLRVLPTLIDPRGTAFVSSGHEEKVSRIHHFHIPSQMRSEPYCMHWSAIRFIKVN